MRRGDERTLPEYDVVHLDVSALPDVLEAVPCRRGRLVVVWDGGTPLGDVVVSRHDLPVSGARLRHVVAGAIASTVVLRGLGARGTRPAASAGVGLPSTALTLADLLDRPLAALQRSAGSGAPAADCPVALVVVAGERPAMLERVLVRARGLRPSPAEVVVVGTAPLPGERLAAALAPLPEARYLDAGRAPLGRALDRAVASTGSPLVAMTTDRVVPVVDWLGQLAAGWVGEALTAGIVMPLRLGSAASVAVHSREGAWRQGYAPRVYDGAEYRAARRRPDRWWSVVSAQNLLLSREAVLATGGFAGGLGLGCTVQAHVYDLWLRALEAGARCRFRPTAVVHREYEDDVQAGRREVVASASGEAVALYSRWRRAPSREHARALAAASRAYLHRGRFAAHAGRDIDPLLIDEVKGHVRGVAEAVLRSSVGPRRR